MPDKELSHTAKITSEKPRGRIRIQLEAPPKKGRLPIDWPVVRELLAIVFSCIAHAGLVAFFGGFVLGLPVVAVLGINMDVAESWLMGIILGGLGVFLVCGITSGLLHQE